MGQKILSKERLALIALVRWMGEQSRSDDGLKIELPGDLHNQVREALGDDFYRPVEKTCERCGGSGNVGQGFRERQCPECVGTGVTDPQFEHDYRMGTTPDE